MLFAVEKLARQAIGVSILMCAFASPLPAVEVFPHSGFVSNQLNFWTNIFQTYPTSTMIIHDAYFPDAVVDILDFQRIGKALGSEQVKNRRLREQMAERYLRRYNVALQRFKQLHHGATRYGAMEERLYKIYKRDPLALRSLYLGQANLRVQAGLADEFQEAARRAQQYLPEMEAIFVGAGVPRDLTRLAFVESMFNTAAKSKVGASGIWQFMPGTARSYMYVNHYIDERNAPLKATKAAAQLLGENYRELRSWPLAITAYNHGQGGMKRAVRKLGSNEYEQVIRDYRSDSFGFASRNFYSEFLAARRTYNEFYANGQGATDSKLTKSIILNKPISVAQLLNFTPLDQQTIRRHNPCLLATAFTTYKYRPLPAYYQLSVPAAIEREVRVAINRIPASPLGRRRS